MFPFALGTSNCSSQLTRKGGLQPILKGIRGSVCSAGYSCGGTGQGH